MKTDLTLTKPFLNMLWLYPGLNDNFIYIPCLAYREPGLWRDFLAFLEKSPCCFRVIKPQQPRTVERTARHSSRLHPSGWHSSPLALQHRPYEVLLLPSQFMAGEGLVLARRLYPFIKDYSFNKKRLGFISVTFGPTEFREKTSVTFSL